MLKINHAFIKKVTLQRVGNKLSQELSYQTEAELPLTEEEEDLLKTFFLGSVRSSHDILKFTHNLSLDYNVIYDNTCKYFKQQVNFVEYSNNVLNHLYEKSNHPQIKTGELFIVLFNEIKFQEITTQGIGIFKIENKIDYLKFNQADDNLDFAISKGVKLQKIDKGCLILNTEESNGFRVFSIDNNSYDANYWKRDFLDLEEVVNDAYQTKHHLQLLNSFSNTLLDNNDSYKQKEFLNKGLQIFNENEVITKDILEEQLLEPFNVVEPFSSFREQYNSDNNINLQEDFQVATNTLKKEKRKIKNQINLDTKIQIKLDLSDSDTVKENIEQGWDNEKKMYYYKVYYNEEM